MRVSVRAIAGDVVAAVGVGLPPSPTLWSQSLAGPASKRTNTRRRRWPALTSKVSVTTPDPPPAVPTEATSRQGTAGQRQQRAVDGGAVVPYAADAATGPRTSSRSRTGRRGRRVPQVDGAIVIETVALRTVLRHWPRELLAYALGRDAFLAHFVSAAPHHSATCLPRNFTHSTSSWPWVHT